MNTPSHHHVSFAARLAIIAATCLTAAGARESRTAFSVTATVLAAAQIESESQPDGLEVSADDVRRGYVEVPQPTALTIRSNSPAGYALDVLTVSPIVSSITVHGFGGAQSLGADGGTIVQRWGSARVVNLTLTFTLVLAPGTVAGRYPWPMRLAVRPLETT